MLENAVDAGATEIKLIINDAGKSLLQVIDNGSGMSETDARMCFERHATSKIQTIEDLFHIRTMGFRGEALASIAAVAQVELKTKRAEDETGTYLEIENSVVKKTGTCCCTAGHQYCDEEFILQCSCQKKFFEKQCSRDAAYRG